MRLKKMAILSLIFLIFFTFLGSGTTISTIAPSVGPGSDQDKIKELQFTLKNWGFYNKPVNGIYGKDTYKAVKDFQEAYGLKPTGLANVDTQFALGLTLADQKGRAFAEGGDISNEQLLARAINGEARGEPYEGQVAVGAVILNRTRDASFPKTIAGVIYQPGAFTAVSDGQINTPINSDSSVLRAARDALNGWDPTDGCIYYWNPATATSKWIWSRQIVKVIGKHNFGK